MEFFDIRFEASARVRYEGVGAGEVRIGTFRERFESDLSDWNESAYERQWDNAAARILTRERAAFITTYAPRSSSNFVRCWGMRRVGDQLFATEQLVFLDRLTLPFDPSAPEQYLTDRMKHSEGDEEISEWTLGVKSMMDFIQRRRSEIGSR